MFLSFEAWWLLEGCELSLCASGCVEKGLKGKERKRARRRDLGRAVERCGKPADPAPKPKPELGKPKPDAKPKPKPEAKTFV